MSRTNAGLDWMSRIMGDTASNASGSYAAANYMGLTGNGTTPSTSDTTLAAEITSGTLARAQCGYAHTDGQSSYTLTKTFTADQSVTLRKIGIFNAPTGGTLVFESLLDSPASVVSGDQISVTETVSL